jgi:hypothetical protein
VFDGGSFAIDSTGAIAHVMPFWTEALAIMRWDRNSRHFICDGPARDQGQHSRSSRDCRPCITR